ncbi:calcium-binding protein [Chachezhania sediminis]|uniref:calcium-binding protein n=1 Tax=Chachezhania sediminis TaxID=2599291 RepID=UPI00131D6709|nr:calcium-binding protein [Chachezhania sediminis]
MSATLSGTDLDPSKHASKIYIVRNLLHSELSALNLRGDEGALDLLFPAGFDDDPDTELTPEEASRFFDLLSEPTYLDSEVVREDDVFAIELNQKRGSGKAGSRGGVVDLEIRFEGRDFSFGADPLGSVLPVDGTLEAFELSLTHNVGRDRLGFADVEVRVAGLELDITPTLFDSTDGYLAQVFAGSQTLSFSPYLIPNFAGDGRNLTAGTVVGANDHITLTDDGRGALQVNSVLEVAGDFLSVSTGATLTGGADTIVGSFPAVTLGNTPGAGGTSVGRVSGDVITASGTVNGGDDTLNFTNSPTSAIKGLFGDAVTATGTVNGGDDEIVGTEFDDVLVGDVGTAKAGSKVTGGDDTIFGLDGNDILIGDVRTAESGATEIGGNDRLFGDAGDDRLIGGAGDDDLDGGAGKDIMLGGAGDDFLIVNEASDVVAGEVYFGAAGVDDFLVFASGFIDFRQVSIIGMEGLQLGGDAGTRVAFLSSQIDRGVFDPDSLIQVFAPKGMVERLIVDVDNGAADLSELEFRDWERGTDEVVVNGSSTADKIIGSVQDDQLVGSGGNDELDGFKGKDTLIGGFGSDTYHFDGNDRIIEQAGQGFDRIIASSNLIRMADNVEHATLADVAGATLVKGNAEDNLIEGNSFDNTLSGGGGGDQIFGVGGSNRLVGGGGGDMINGANGKDIILGGKGNDLADGGGAKDVIKGGSGDDDAFGGNGNDRLFGQRGDDILDGGKGKDRLNGGADKDVLVGGKGADVLTGGGGADEFVFTDTDGRAVDRITDFRSADTIVLEGKGFGLKAGVLADAAFAFVPGEAISADTRIIYNGTNGKLFFDADGKGGDNAQLLAQMEEGLALSADDFLVLL